MAHSKAIRVIPELRNYHLETLGDYNPATVFFFGKKYDLDPTLRLETIRRTNLLGLLWTLLRTSADTLEIWEPLWMRLLPVHVLSVFVFRLGRLLRGKGATVCSYCLENNDFSALLGGARPLHYWITTALKCVVGLYVGLSYSRLCFASPSARDAYCSLPFLSRVECKIVLDLPARPRALTLLSRPPQVLFLARLEERKGLKILFDCWSLVEDALPSAILAVAGDGPLRSVANAWASHNPANRRFEGSVNRDESLDLLAASRVLVLPSIRAGRWREQIGLPIQEALQAGLTIVTTSETGLARWLEQRGHFVTDNHPNAVVLAHSIIGALTEPLAPEEVVKELPDIDGRVAASFWLR